MKVPHPHPSARRPLGSTHRLLFVALVGGTLLATGCAHPFRAPIRIGVTSLDLSPLPPFLPKRFLFAEDLQTYLDEPVIFDLLQPRQIRVHLGTGRLKFAMLTPADYAEIMSADNCQMVAVPRNPRGQIYRRGLIVVSPRSRIQSLAELRKVRFHFLPLGDVLNEVAMGALLDAGIQMEEVDKGILGLQLDTLHINSVEVAKSVVIEENAAGIIDEDEYNTWPERGGSLLLFAPSKEQVRVIGKTVRVPEGPFVASKETPRELVDKVRDYLFESAGNKALVFAALGCSGFAEPISPDEYRDYAALHEKLKPLMKLPTSQAASQPAEP